MCTNDGNADFVDIHLKGLDRERYLHEWSIVATWCGILCGLKLV